MGHHKNKTILLAILMYWTENTQNFPMEFIPAMFNIRWSIKILSVNWKSKRSQSCMWQKTQRNLKPRQIGKTRFVHETSSKHRIMT